MSSEGPTGPPHAVLLDIDDTLLDTTSAMLAAGGRALAAVWPGRSPQWYAEAAARFRADPGGYFGEYTAGRMAFEDMRVARLAEVARNYGEVVTDGDHTAYERVYVPAFRAAQQVFADVPDFLDRARVAGVRVGGLTNASAAVTTMKLDAVGLTDCFQVLVTRDSLGFGKPDARVFRHACDAMGEPPSRTWYVGDELVADAIGALDAGLTAYWLRRPEQRQAAHHGAEVAVPSQVRVVSGLAQITFAD